MRYEDARNMRYQDARNKLNRYIGYLRLYEPNPFQSDSDAADFLEVVEYALGELLLENSIVQLHIRSSDDWKDFEEWTRDKRDRRIQEVLWWAERRGIDCETPEDFNNDDIEED